MIPINHIVPDFKKFGILSIWTLSDIFDMIDSAVLTKIIGTIIDWNIFEIKFIINSNIGCNILAETILPVVIINVISNGISNWIKPVIFCMASFVIEIISVKFDIIIVAIKIYWT